VRALLAVLLVMGRQAFAADPALLDKELALERGFVQDLIVAPIPISNPTIGTGLAVLLGR